MTKNAAVASLLSTIPPFQYLNPTQTEALLAGAGVRSERLPKGSRIVRGSPDLNRVIILISGSVESEVVLPSGKTLRVNRIDAPDVIGAALLFAERRRRGAFSPDPVPSINAVTGVYILTIELASFRDALRRYPALLDGFLEYQSERFLRISGRMQYLALGGIKQQAALYLLELPRDPDNRVQLSMTITALARHFAVERPSLSAVLGELEDSGYIRRLGNGRIVIVDTDGLEALLLNG